MFWGAKRRVGERGGLQASQQAPRPPPELWDRMEDGPWAETHTLVHTSALSGCWVTQVPPHPHAKQD